MRDPEITSCYKIITDRPGNNSKENNNFWKGLFVDPIPNSLKQHLENFLADSKENYF